MGSFFQACPAPGSSDLLLGWDVESLKSGGGLGGRLSQAGRGEEPTLGVGRWRHSIDTVLGAFFWYGDDQYFLIVPVIELFDIVGGLRPSQVVRCLCCFRLHTVC